MLSLDCDVQGAEEADDYKEVTPRSFRLLPEEQQAPGLGKKYIPQVFLVTPQSRP